MSTLSGDVRLAEDLAIRFADSQGDRDSWRAKREACEAILFAGIATTHGVSSNEVAAARAALDARPFDWAVNLPMLGIGVLMAWPVTRRLRRRFEGEPIPLIFSMLLASIAIGVVIVALGQVWAGYIEMLRLGNGHLSYRAQRIQWVHHRGETFVVVVVAVWCLSFVRDSDKPHPTP